jgi:hypothetical protein
MSEIKELMARIAEGDDDAQAELEKLFADKDSAAARDKALTAREMRLKTDAALKAKFPRALKAYEADDLNLPEDLSDDALVAALTAKEAKLEAMGVPAPTVPVDDPPAVVKDPAQAWATQRGNTGPGTQQPESAEPALREHLEQGSTVRQIVDDIHALHREGHGRGLGAFHDTITRDYESEAHPNSVI